MGGGGLHSVDTPAVITPSSPEHQLIDVDVASYYPAILINHKLHPEHLTVGFAEVYEGIRDERIRIKRAGQKLEKELIRLRKELAELT
jgi:DNA polymerase elongation subunit (family B)